MKPWIVAGSGMAGFLFWLSTNPDPAYLLRLIPVLLASGGLLALVGYLDARKHRIEQERKRREAMGLRLFVEGELLRAQMPRPGYRRREIRE